VSIEFRRKARMDDELVLELMPVGPVPVLVSVLLPVPVVPVAVAALPVVGGVAWKRAWVAVDSRPADATNEPVGRLESDRTSKRYVSLSIRGVTKIRPVIVAVDAL
jgi:hypothetical protein